MIPDETREIEEQIRDAPIIGNPSGVFYRVRMYKGNLFVYRHVFTGDMYRGMKYRCEGYALAWTDMQGELVMVPPSFIPRKRSGEE